LIVVDTNILAHLFICGEFSGAAEQVYAKDPQWAAPLLWRSEFRNVLIKCMGKRHVGFDDALDIMRAAEYLMADKEYAVPSDDVLRLASVSGCTAYDAEFVVLARDLGTKLVTTDKQLRKLFPDKAIAPDRFAAGK